MSSEITLTVIQGEVLSDWEITPEGVEVDVGDVEVEITPISGLVNPPLTDSAIATNADISAYKIDQAELSAIINSEVSGTLAQIQSDLDSLDATVQGILDDTSLFVQVAGNQTISGIKTFENPVPMADPTADSHGVTLGYLTDRLPGYILFGTSAPTSGDGAVGDLYFQWVA